MDMFHAHHADILDPAQQPRVIALLREHGLVTFTGITDRTTLASAASWLMSIRPLRDAAGARAAASTGTSSRSLVIIRTAHPAVPAGCTSTL